jgi:hypothetical protein
MLMWSFEELQLQVAKLFGYKSLLNFELNSIKNHWFFEGWGCGYRTTQTLCSWIRNRQNESEDAEKSKPIADVPSVVEIQKILVKCEDKPKSFVSSKQWIGAFECSIVLDYLYDVPCKILHCEPYKLQSYLADIVKHFETIKSPIMMVTPV